MQRIANATTPTTTPIMIGTLLSFDLTLPEPFAVVPPSVPPGAGLVLVVDPPTAVVPAAGPAELAAAKVVEDTPAVTAGVSPDGV